MDWTIEQIRRLAEAWVMEERCSEDGSGGDAGQTVVLMNFTAPADMQWLFINEASAIARSDDELSAIAAGPLEHLLSRHGDDYIEAVEKQSRDNPQFARMTTFAWQCGMADEVWSRLQAIKATVRDPM